MIRQSILLALLFTASLQLGAQIPRNITFLGDAGAQRVVPCPDNDAGTITFDFPNFAGQSNDIDPDTIYLCFGDTLPVLHNQDWTINGDPNPATPAGVAYAFYDCRPTVDGPDTMAVLNDPCLNKANPLIVGGVSFPQTNGIWVAVDDDQGNVNLINNGFHQEAFNMGNPAPIQLWFAPITVDNINLLAYENGGPCVSVSVGEAFSVVYLEAIEVTETFPDTGPGLQGAFSVENGLPEFEPGATYGPITINHLGGDVLAGTVLTPSPDHGDTVQYTVPRPGAYEVVIEDGKSCAGIDTLVMPVIFSAGAANGAPGDTVCVEIRVDNLVDVTVAQFTLAWDPAILGFVEVANLNSMLPGLDGSAFGTTQVGQGELAFAWADLFAGSNSLPDGSVLFEICFEITGTLGQSSPVDFIDDPMGIDIEVGSANNTPFQYPFETSSGSVSVTGSSLLVQTSQDSVSCNGLSDGAFTVTVTGGAGPYNFTWNTFPPTGPENGPITIANSGGSGTVGGRLAGEYRIIVTDSDMPANMDTVFVEVLQGPEFAVNVAELQSPTCFGDMDGALTANVTINGVAVPNPGSIFTFQWDVPGQTGQVLANIPSSTHSVTVTDASGCQEVDSGSLSQPGPLQILANNTFITDATCSGAMDGAILVGASGGTTANGNYTYAWSGGLGTITANTSQVSNLDPGTYSVTVTDDNNCMIEEDYPVSAAKILLVNLISLENVSCNGAGDGSIEVNGTATGQQPIEPFTYTWSTIPPGQTFTGPLVTGLGPGQYVVVAADDDPAGCFVSDTFTITEPAPLVILEEALGNETCDNGGGDGFITISVSGGTYPYTYSWTGGQADSTATNLSAGMYTVDVTDANNCAASQTFNIIAPTPPQVTQLNDDTLDCSDDTNGSLSVLATPGGAPIQSYNWSNNATGQTITNLSPGTYTVTITATDGCFTVDTALVVAPAPIMIDSIIGESPNCPGDDNGILFVYASGGTLPYRYVLGNSTDTTSNSVFPGLSAGDYPVTVIDANGCTPAAGVGTVVDPPTIEVTFSDITGVSCFEGVCDGGAMASAVYSDGTPGLFRFSWASGEVDVDVMSSTATGLCRGPQALVVSDVNSCSSEDTVMIPSPPEIRPSSSISNVSCNGLEDGQITITVSGGTPGYTYFWEETGETTATISGLTAGSYNVVVTDANNCEDRLSAVVAEPNPLVLSVNTDETEDVSCFGEEDGVLVVTYNFDDTTINQVGQEPYTWSSNVPAGSASSSLGVATNLPAGTYSVTITDLEGCQDSLAYTLMEPTEIMAVIPDPADPPCFNSTTKVNIDTVFGGAGTELADYQYMVDGNGILLPINVAADIFGDGAHDVEIFDLNGCSALFQVDIDQPEEILVTFPEDPFVVELGDTTRQLQPIITPLSTQVDSFIWSPADYLSDPTVRNPFVRPLESLDYELTVVDVNGCEGMGSVFVELDANRNIYIPNAFSPNGDGVNDEFRVFPCVGVANIASVNIFNRWGDLIYQGEGQDVSNGLYCIGGLPLWDGRFKDEDMKPDVYVYVIEVEFLDNITLVYRGDVSILR